MAVGNVLAAIQTRWDAQELDDTVTGGIRRRRGKNISAPYVICSTIGNAVELRTSGSGSAGSERIGKEYARTQFQLLLYHAGGPAAARTVIAAIRAGFDYAPLTLDSGALLYCRFVSETLLDDPEDPGHPNAVLWALTYDALTAEDANQDPA